ncbi:MAG: ATP-binding protein [Gammaproteobacteria bacterium]
MKLSATTLRSKVLSIIVLSALTLFSVYFVFLQNSVTDLEQDLAERLVRQETTIIANRATSLFDQDRKLIEQTLLRNDFQQFMHDQDNISNRQRAVESIEYNCTVINCSGWFIFSHKTLKGLDWNKLTDTVVDLEIILERDQWYTNLVNSGKTYITDVNLHPIEKVPYVFLDYVVKENDQVLGLVGFFSSIDRVVESILNFSGQATSNFLIDEDGAIRASEVSGRESEIDALIKLNNGAQLEQFYSTDQLLLFNDAARDARENNSSTTLSLTINDASYYVAIEYLAKYNWYAVSMFPYQNMTDIVNTLPFILITLIVLFVFVVFASYTLNQQMFSPIVTMNRTLGDIAAGDYSKRVSYTRDDEIGFLANGINVMAEQIANNLSQIEQQNEQLNHAIAQANQANEAKTRFLANMSHELRSPMNAVLGFAQLGLDTKPPQECNDYLTKLKLSAEHLTMIISDILDFSKIESDELILEQISFSYNDIIDKILNICSITAAEKDLDILVETAPDIPKHLIGDPLRIEQIFINLLNNAIKFTEQGKITITSSVAEISHEQVQLTIHVEDTGIGMTQEQQEHLFTAFNQADTSITRRYGGTGLGLAISKELVESMGGNIRVTSQENQGTTFSFNITLGISESPLPEAEVVIDTKSEDLSTHAQGKVALIVEDDKTNQFIARKLLKKIGLECHIANNGLEGVEMAADHPYALIYMDIQMPVMDGLTACKKILEHNNDTIIVGMSANASSEDIKLAMDCGMKAYITKPIDRDILYQTTLKYI